MKKITLLFVLLFGFTVTANAQFLKKLGKKVEKAAEKAVEKKAEQKTTKETEKAFDSTFNKKKKRRKNSTIPSLSKADPAESYSFNHRAVMQLKTGKELLDITYFLPDTGDFLCAMIEDRRTKHNSLTVFDIDRDAMFTFMENDGQKIKMGISLETESAFDNAKNEASIKITATGNSKTILGYNCQEFKMTGEDMTATIWVTKDTNIRFPSSFYSIKQGKKSNNQAWMKDLDGWAMEMTMIDTSKKKSQTITMNCLSIDESKLKINSNEYQNIGY